LLGRLLAILFFLVLAGGAYVGWDAWRFMNTAPQAEGRDVVVVIKPGFTLAQAAAQLEEKGVSTDARRFRLLARLREQGTSIQAGHFLVNSGWTPQRVLDQLVSGQALLQRVTIPEGLPWWAVGRILEKERLCTAADFKRVIHDPAFLEKKGIPFASAEGFLYPDTYLVPRPQHLDEKAARVMASRLVDTFWRKADLLWKGERPSAAKLLRAVTLASIVEKETGLPSERARVAGVYANRLERGMLLQADPTIIYGLGSDFSGPIRRSHLNDKNNPYNTYVHAGLPPGPICSPGQAALRAALEPEQHQYLYFVATGTDRSHVFSRTLAEHNRAVSAYRKAMRESGK